MQRLLLRRPFITASLIVGLGLAAVAASCAASGPGELALKRGRIARQLQDGNESTKSASMPNVAVNATEEEGSTMWTTRIEPEPMEDTTTSSGHSASAESANMTAGIEEDDTAAMTTTGQPSQEGAISSAQPSQGDTTSSEQSNTTEASEIYSGKTPPSDSESESETTSEAPTGKTPPSDSDSEPESEPEDSDTSDSSGKIPPSDDSSKPTPYRWLTLVDGIFYINLPEDENWSEYGPLRTMWRMLRIMGAPLLGDTSVEIALRDWTFATSNGQWSSGHKLDNMAWGIAADCADEESHFRVNLVGTPFRYSAPYMAAHGNDAHGAVNCTQEGQVCQASCGGWCGYCGLGHPATTAHATLAVIDRALFDAGIEALTTSTSTSTTRTTTTLTTTRTTTTQTITTTTYTTTTQAADTLEMVLGRFTVFVGALMVLLAGGAWGMKRLRGGKSYDRFDDDGFKERTVMGRRTDQL